LGVVFFERGRAGLCHRISDPKFLLSAVLEKFLIFFKKFVDSPWFSGNLSIPFDGDRVNRFVLFPPATVTARPKPSLSLRAAEITADDF